MRARAGADGGTSAGMSPTKARAWPADNGLEPGTAIALDQSHAKHGGSHGRYVAYKPPTALGERRFANPLFYSKDPRSALARP